MIMTDDIYHFGVKGMKWGQRKQRESKGSMRSRWKNRDMSDAARYTRHRKVAGATAGVVLLSGGVSQYLGGILYKIGGRPAASLATNPVSSAAIAVGLGVVGAHLGTKFAVKRQAKGKAGYQKQAALEGRG